MGAQEADAARSRSHCSALARLPTARRVFCFCPYGADVLRMAMPHLGHGKGSGRAFWGAGSRRGAEPKLLLGPVLLPTARRVFCFCSRGADELRMAMPHLGRGRGRGGRLGRRTVARARRRSHCSATARLPTARRLFYFCPHGADVLRCSARSSSLAGTGRATSRRDRLGPWPRR